jgi:hypothetical protein
MVLTVLYVPPDSRRWRGAMRRWRAWCVLTVLYDCLIWSCLSYMTVLHGPDSLAKQEVAGRKEALAGEVRPDCRT